MSQVSEQEKIQVRLQSVNAALDSGATLQVEQMLAFLHPTEVADLLESLPPKEREQVWDMVEPGRAGAILAYIDHDEVRSGLIGDMESYEVAAATEGLATDDVADIIQDLSPAAAEDVLQAMDEQDRARVKAVLSYPEDSAGGLMNTDVYTVRADMTLDVVSSYLRSRGSLPSGTDSLFVVNRENIYQGVITIVQILIEDTDALIADVMDTDIEPIIADLHETDIAKIFEQRDLISAPVVDDSGHLIGRITVDDVLDIVREQGEQSLLRTAGLDRDQDMFAPVIHSARSRALWLGVNLATAFLAAWVIGQFEATIDQLVALAVLMPVVASMGGVAGSQTLTLVIRGMALGQIGSANIKALLYKELLVGLLNGLFWAVVVSVVAFGWFDNAWLGVVIGAALVINMFTAAAAGTLIPLVLARMKIDPALAGGVILTTVTDVIGFWAFLGLATIFLLG